MLTCILCGQSADYFLIYEMTWHRIEVVLCNLHLEVVSGEMPEQENDSKLKIRIERITSDSIVPGPLTTRFPPPPQESTG